MRLAIGLAVATLSSMSGQPGISQSPGSIAPNAAAASRGASIPPEIEKCLYGDHYGCVLTLRKDRERLSPAARRCIEDLEVQGMDDSHPIATPECRDLVLGR